jgi:hypothetical protein
MVNASNDAWNRVLIDNYFQVKDKGPFASNEK